MGYLTSQCPNKSNNSKNSSSNKHTNRTNPNKSDTRTQQSSTRSSNAQPLACLGKLGQGQPCRFWSPTRALLMNAYKAYKYACETRYVEQVYTTLRALLRPLRTHESIDTMIPFDVEESMPTYWLAVLKIDVSGDPLDPEI